MPLPTDTLLRVQASPVPTQTFFTLDGSIAMAPIDCTGCSSNTGLKVVAPSVDFQTPPLAEPTNRVTLPESSLKPARAEIRPLMAAEPMLRAPRPDMVPESTAAAAAAGVGSGAAARLLAAMPPDNTAAAVSASSHRIRILLPDFPAGLI